MDESKTLENALVTVVEKEQQETTTDVKEEDVLPEQVTVDKTSEQVVSDKPFETMVESMKETFLSGITRPYNWRVDQLQKFIAMFEENKSEWEEAQVKDLAQVDPLKTTEITMSVNSAKYLLENLKSFMKEESVELSNAANLPAEGFIQKEPLGVVLIISPWNYPISLLAIPLSAALAAGNLVILKPSEVSQSVSSTFSKLVSKYFDEKYVKCIEGDASITSDLLKEPYDHIFYTGSIRVGKIIMKAAAEHLTPVTLELGGKSPCIVDENIDIQVAANRIAWSKALNCGQTCVSPDYLLVDSRVALPFIEALKESFDKMYGKDASTSEDYSRIITVNHTKRLVGMIDQAKDKVIYGGIHDENNRFIHPTLILNPDTENDLCMQDEIFGPILPIIIYGPDQPNVKSQLKDLNHAIRFILKRSKPLALYIFSKDQILIEKITSLTQSGSVGINECILQVSEEHLPFGGIGSSGMGAYHGQDSFFTFTHRKSILKKKFWLDMDLRYPPYTESKRKNLSNMMSDNFFTRHVLPVGGSVLGVVNKFFK